MVCESTGCGYCSAGIFGRIVCGGHCTEGNLSGSEMAGGSSIDRMFYFLVVEKTIVTSENWVMCRLFLT